MSQERSRVDDQVMELGQEWAAAEQRADTAFLDRLLTDDFTGIGPRGFMLTKEEWLARHRSGDLKYASLRWDEVRVRVYGDAAVATGRQTQQGTYRQHDIASQFRVTQVFTKQGDRWRLAALQLSPIAAAG